MNDSTWIRVGIMKWLSDRVVNAAEPQSAAGVDDRAGGKGNLLGIDNQALVSWLRRMVSLGRPPQGVVRASAPTEKPLRASTGSAAER